MSNTPSSLRHLQRLAVLAHIGSLLFLLSACSGAPVSLGSGIDDQESALTETPSGSSMDPNQTAVDCAINPLGDGCPTAVDCAINPLGDGCPTADEMEVDCGRAVSDCYADVMTNGDDPARCEMLRAGCSSSEPTEVPVDCGQLVNDCYADAMTNGDDSARCEMLRGACPQGSGSPEPRMGD